MTSKNGDVVYQDDGSQSHQVTLVGSLTGTSIPNIGRVGGYVTVIRVEKTRPADTTAYAVNDAVGGTTNWTFPAARSGGPGTGVVCGVNIATDDTANVNVLELDLYDASITDIADNVEATHLYANIGKFLQTIQFSALAKKTATSTQAEAYSPCAVIFSAVDLTNIYGVLRTTNTDTPVSAAKTTITLYVSQD